MSQVAKEWDLMVQSLKGFFNHPKLYKLRISITLAAQRPDKGELSFKAVVTWVHQGWCQGLNPLTLWLSVEAMTSKQQCWGQFLLTYFSSLTVKKKFYLISFRILDSPRPSSSLWGHVEVPKEVHKQLFLDARILKFCLKWKLLAARCKVVSEFLKHCCDL